MATPTFVQNFYHENTSASTTCAATNSAAQTAGNLNVVMVWWNDAVTTISSIVDTKGNSYTQFAGSPKTQGTATTMAMYYCSNIAGAAIGANTVTVTLSASLTFSLVAVVEYSNVAQSTPVDVTATPTSGTSGSSISITTTNASDLILTAFGTNGGYTGAGTGFTNRMVSATFGDIIDEKVVTSTGTYTDTPSPSQGASWIGMAIAFKAGTPATQSLSPTGIASTAAFGSAVLAGGSITAVGIASTLGFGTPTVTGSAYSLPAARLPGGVAWKRSDVGCKLNVAGITDANGLNTTGRTIFQTLSSTATAAQINTAIQNCPAGQTVHLNAGTYTLNATLNLKSGVCLEGAGRDVTNLNFTSAVNNGAIYFPGPFQDPGTVVSNITAGMSQGSTTVTVASATGFAVGDLVGIDQLNDTSIGFVNFIQSQNSVDTSQSRASGTRMQGMYTTITAIAGNNITLERPILWNNLASGLTPQLWQIGTAASIVHDAGIQHLTTSLGATTNQGTNVAFQGCYNCWINDCHLQYSTAYIAYTYQCCRIEIRHCTIQFTTSYASSSYGTYLWYAGNCLIEDNIFDTVAEACPMAATSSGNIFGYNFVNNSKYTVSSTWQVETTYQHGASTMNLWEGNWTPNFWSDFIHGSNAWQTSFRNRVLGQALNAGTLTTDNTDCIVMESHNWYGSHLGNVLGTAGWHNAYAAQNATLDTKRYIFISGYGDATNTANDASTYPGSGTTAYDSQVWATEIILGNYNYFNNAIPASESLSGQGLPPSQYYSSQPAWWVMTWPPIDAGNPAAVANTSIQAGYRWVNGVDPSGPTILVSPGIGSTNQFGNAVVSPGSVGVTAAGIGSTNLFGTAQIASGSTGIGGIGIGSTNQFGTPALVGGTAPTGGGGATVSPGSLSGFWGGGYT